MLRVVVWLVIGVPLAVFAGHQALQLYTDTQRPDIDAQVGYDELLTVPINGTRQWVHIRGTDRANPTLLFLHGGPGTPMMPFGPQFQNRWETSFNVVHWDQRGSGKTYFEQDTPSPTFDDMFSDAKALVTWLREYVGQEQIYLLGHSWGTMLGAPLVQEHPEWFAAFIATGMVVQINANERAGYEHTLSLARTRNDMVAVSALEALAPYPNINGQIPPGALMTLRRWQTHYGVGISRRFGDDSLSALTRYALASPEYSMLDASYFLRDVTEHWAALDPFIQAYDIRTHGTQFDVPVVFILGRHDWQTPSTLASDFFWQELQAPHKRLVWLEDSAHTPYIDEPHAFARELVGVKQLVQ